MDLPWPAIWTVLATLAALQSFLLWLQSFEHRRVVDARLGRAMPPERTPHVHLIVPCKGLETQLEDNLRPILDQDYPNYSVTFVVEDANDPACGPIGRAIDAGGRRTEAKLLAAGRCTSGGQKVHNLVAATGELPRDTEVIAFIDSDARPQRSWLTFMIGRLEYSESAAVTGYRWFMPLRPTLANHVLYSINATVAAMIGKERRLAIWGGAWGIRRDVFDALALRDKWRGTLSDDLVATRALHDAREKVVFEPACLIPSPLDMDWKTALNFLRRQLMMGRFYLPLAWLGAICWTTVGVLCFWGTAVAASATIVRGNFAAWSVVAAFVAAYVMHVARGLLRRDLAELYLPGERNALKSASRFDIWLAPVAGAVAWFAMLSSLAGRRLTWRGITYAVGANGQAWRMGTETVEHGPRRPAFMELADGRRHPHPAPPPKGEGVKDR